MSENTKASFPRAKPSRWGHPLVFLASVVGLAGTSAVYYAQIRARQKARNLFLEKPFYQEALSLTAGYKPIMEKLVEPIEPLQIDPTSKFNHLSPLGAQVSLLLPLMAFSSYQINVRIIATQLKVQRTESFVHSR